FGAGLVVEEGRQGPSRGIILANNIVTECANQTGGVQFFIKNTTTDSSIRLNDFWYKADEDAVVDDGAAQYTAAAWNGRMPASGEVVYGNVQEDPCFSGGELPAGLDEEYRPRPDYFRLTDRAPETVRKTGNPLRGDADHGYSGESGKFEKDIYGNPREDWSMGACEYVPSP
ncbi:MAG: hypothetical protein V1918_09710, partial [Planctomycetota bacterium]